MTVQYCGKQGCYIPLVHGLSQHSLSSCTLFGFGPCLLWSKCLKRYVRRRNRGWKLKKKLMRCEVSSDTPHAPATFSQSAIRCVVWVQSHCDSKLVWRGRAQVQVPEVLVLEKKTTVYYDKLTLEIPVHLLCLLHVLFPPALLTVTQASIASLLLHLLFGLSLTEPTTTVEKCQFWYYSTLLSVIWKPAEPARGQIVPLHMGLFCFRQVSYRFGHVSVTWKEQRAEQPGSH